jgi:hypothetical protein
MRRSKKQQGRVIMARLQSLRKGVAQFEVGQSYWELLLRDGTAEWREWVLASVQPCFPKSVPENAKKNYGGQWAYLIHAVHGVTCTNGSKEGGEREWAENVTDQHKMKVYLHKALRVNAPDEEGYQLPRGVYGTKLQAAKFALREFEIAVVECLAEASKALSVDKADWLEDSKIQRQNVAATKRVIVKLTKENKS